MSDGISEAYKYERESAEHAEVLMATATHLMVKTQDTWDKLVELLDNRSRETYEHQVTKVLAGDLQQWALFMLDCQENNMRAFERVAKIVPWPKTLKIRRLNFDRWSGEADFWRPFFHRNGYATSNANGNRSGYDSYALLYEENLDIKQIVLTSIWLGFKTTGWPGNGTPVSPVPTTPWRKDRLK